jgi:hypothetical protein
MKIIMYLFLGIVIISQSCQSDSKLTDSEKDALVQDVMKTSQQFFALSAQPHDTGSFRNFIKFVDENADQSWQTDPVAAVDNITITKTMSEWIIHMKAVMDRRISTNPKILESHFFVLSKDKVIEVNKGDFAPIMTDSTVRGPFTMVNTIVWGNINGEWKMQFFHESTARKSE